MNSSLTFTQRLALASADSLSNADFNRLASDKHPKIRLKIAQRRDTPSQILKRLSSDKDTGTRVFVGKNLNTTPEILAYMANDNNPHVLAAVVKNPNLSRETLANLAKYDGPANDVLKAQGRSMQGRVAKHPNTSFKVLEKLAKSPEEWVRIKVLKNPKTPHYILKLVMGESFDDEWMYVKIINKCYPDEQMLERLSMSESRTVRWNAYRALPPNLERVERMSQDTYDHIRKTAAESPFISEITLNRLVRDESYFVRCGAAKNPNLTPKMVDRISRDDDYNPRYIIAENPLVTPEILRRLSTHSSHFVRKAVAKNEKTPQDILKQLCKDPDWMVRSALLENKSLSTLFLRSNFEFGHLTDWEKNRLEIRDAPPNLYELAGSSETPIKVLAEIASIRLDLEGMRKLRGKNYEQNGWTEKSLLKAAPKEALRLLDPLARNPSLTTDLLEQVFRRAFDEIDVDYTCACQPIYAAIQHPNTNSSMIAEIYEKAIALERKELEAEKTMSWKNYRLDYIYRMKRVIANSPVAPSNILDILGSHSCVRIRASVGKNPQTSLETLCRLARDPEFIVKLRVIHLDNIPHEVGKILKLDPVMSEIYEARLAGEYDERKRHAFWIKR